jgi:hypothetical protein
VTGITFVSVGSGADVDVDVDVSSLVEVNEINSVDVAACTSVAVGSDNGAQVLTPSSMRSTKPDMILAWFIRPSFLSE